MIFALGIQSSLGLVGRGRCGQPDQGIRTIVPETLTYTKTDNSLVDSMPRIWP